MKMGIPYALFNVVAYRNGYRYYHYTEQTYSQRLLAVGADVLIAARKNLAFSSPLPSSPRLAQGGVRPVHRLLHPALRSGCGSSGYFVVELRRFLVDTASTALVTFRIV
jgi:hypothetical protein